MIDVARRNGVSRQTVHTWLKKYANEGLAGLSDGSARPLWCPHQMPPAVEAKIVELRREHPGWGPRTIAHQLAKAGVDPVPGRSSIYRCLVRHRLITPEARKRKRSDYVRWERSKVPIRRADRHLAHGAPETVVAGPLLGARQHLGGGAPAEGEQLPGERGGTGGDAPGSRRRRLRMGAGTAGRGRVRAGRCTVLERSVDARPAAR